MEAPDFELKLEEVEEERELVETMEEVEFEREWRVVLAVAVVAPIAEDPVEVLSGELGHEL